MTDFVITNLVNVIVTMNQILEEAIKKDNIARKIIWQSQSKSSIKKESVKSYTKKSVHIPNN